ncbi:MAG: type II secretion system protein [Alphaproteobacteria bacterium]
MKLMSGFTLVELAVVMVIVGLLTGGVLKGVEMMESARVSKTIEQIEGYVYAHNTFYDKYRALPGDMWNASSRLFGCDAGVGCFSGDGNGVIGDITSQPWRDISIAPDSENALFWKHLALADLIPRVSVTQSSGAEWGAPNPKSFFSGGFFMHTSARVGAYPNLSGRMFVMRNSLDGRWLCGGGGGFGQGGTGACSIDPISAARIDTKIDDSIADSGFIQGGSANSFSNGCGRRNLGVNGPTGYDLQMSDRNCDLFVRF